MSIAAITAASKPASEAAKKKGGVQRRGTRSKSSKSAELKICYQNVSDKPIEKNHVVTVAEAGWEGFVFKVHAMPESGGLVAIDCIQARFHLPASCTSLFSVSHF